MRPGDVVVDRFEIEHEAGAGGMGTVFRAVDRRTGARVALKVLRYEDDGDMRARFAREATLLATLEHPRIVRYIDHGIAGDELYLAMEWLDGEDLARRLSRGPLSVMESVALSGAIADALAAAHARGIVHRDVKPSNVFLVNGDLGAVKLLDFGIAWAAAATRIRTSTGSVLGTPGYMAPEQARGERSVDARADVFSLGCVLFECLTGRPAFTAAHALAILAKILFEEAPRVADLTVGIPLELDEIVARMLSKEVSQRPADAHAVAEALESISRAREGGPVTGLTRQSALTANERRHVSIILVAAPSLALATTLPTSSATSAPSMAIDKLRNTLGSAPSAKLEVLLDGSVIGMLSGADAPTDDARMAASCALALREAGPTAAIALSSGRAEIGAGAPVGEVIDRAAQLLSLARSSEVTAAILIDDITASLLDTRFIVREAPDGRRLEGRSERETVRTLLGRPTSCVGREAELALLDALLDQCLEEPVARAVLITSPAGIGKSRLRHEFLRRVNARPSPVQCWICRGYPMRSGASLGLAAQLLRATAGVLDGEPPTIQREKLIARVAQRVPATDVPEVSEFLGEIVGTPFPDEHRPKLRAARRDPSALRDQMQLAWEALVAAECAAAPLILVIEDMHWGDAASLDLVGAALRRCPELPLLVVALARPDVRELFPNIWADRNLQEVRLAPLTRKASERLVRSVLPDAAAPAIARLVDQSAGNAFYLEELIRAYHEGTGDSPPATVLAMVGARISAFEPPARQILRAASIFGESFWAGGVAALLGAASSASATSRWLDTLVQRETIGLRATSKLHGEREYVFRHSLVREAAYATLTEQDRVLGHRLAAEWLARMGGDDPLVIAERAQHTERVGKALLAAGDADAAASHFAQAGLMLLRLRSLEDCIRTLVAALRSCDAERREVSELVEWLRALADAVFRIRHAPEFISVLDRALRRIDAVGLLEERVIARVDAARALASVNLFDDASRRLEEAFSLAGDEPLLRSKVLIVEMEAALRNGDFARGLRAVEELEALGPLQSSLVLLAVAWVRAIAGDRAAALRAIDQAAALDAPDDLVAAVEHEKQRGLVYIFLREYQAAIDASVRAVELARASGLRYAMASTLHNIGDASIRIGEFGRAYAALTESKEVAESMGHERLTTINRIFLGFLDGVGGVAGALEMLRDLVNHVDSQGFLTDALEGRFLLGLLHKHRGELAEARRELEQVLAKARELGNRLIAEDAREALEGV